jgi:hypothetical protein
LLPTPRRSIFDGYAPPGASLAAGGVHGERLRRRGQAAGSLHLRIAGDREHWTAEVMLLRSLGYGTYSFVVRETGGFEPGGFEPAVAFSMFT